MKASIKMFIGMACIAVSACSSQQTKQDNIAVGGPEKKPVAASGEAPSSDSQKPPMTTAKNGNTLNLVRVMDGAVCKNDLEGVKGVFLVYANPQDIERIKREQGAKVFGSFEAKIQHFSGQALQQAANATNLSNDPFALGEDTARQKLAGQLSQNFRTAATDLIKAFEQETGLQIDVSTYTPSLVFFQKGCEANLGEPETPSPDGASTGSY